MATFMKERENSIMLKTEYKIGVSEQLRETHKNPIDMLTIRANASQPNPSNPYTFAHIA